MYQGRELLPPKSDLVFKALFGSEDNKAMLADFLSAMLDMKYRL